MMRQTMIHPAIKTLRALLALAVATCIGAALAADGADDDVYKASDRPLDERIDPAKITEQDPPPLPQQVILPLPPDHRLAKTAGEVPISEAHWRAAHAAISRGVKYLQATQEESGGWMADVRAAPTDQPDKPSPIAVAVTAMVLKSIAQAEPELRFGGEFHAGIAFIKRSRNQDGSYEGGALTNYVTSTVVSAMAGIDEYEHHGNIRQGTVWLQDAQWDQSEGLQPRQDWFGGAGYGSNGRPDLSNTQMMLDALYDAGLSPDEPAFQKALAFLTRTQNLKATNSAGWAGDDGGFIYTPANGGESFASEMAGEGRYGEIVPEGNPRSLRSYGSMTYAGFKSMLYAGLSPDDVRVRAAFDWIRRNWTFEENPGLGQQGLYYFYHTMARALRIAQQHEITDLAENEHNWREELIDALVKRQRDDGSWINEADRWLESRPPLTTAYALLALEEALKPVSGLPKPGDDAPQ